MTLTFDAKIKQIDLIEVKIKNDDMSKWALDFLNIFNNARENPKMIYKVTTEYDSNSVFLYTNPKSRVNLVEWLSGFGTVDVIPAGEDEYSNNALLSLETTAATFKALFDYEIESISLDAEE